MNKIKILWILDALMMLCFISAEIVKNFSRIACWVLWGCWAVFAIAIFVDILIIFKDVKRQEQALKPKIDAKYLEELITKYLAISLESENENKED